MHTAAAPQITRASRPRRTRPQRRNAFTLIEIMIVVLIIGILLNMAMPGILHAREGARSKACIKNLKTIDMAKEQYVIDKRLSIGATPLSTDLYGTGNYIKSTPSCPTSGTAGYAINAVGTFPTCIVGTNLSGSTSDDHIMTQ